MGIARHKSHNKTDQIKHVLAGARDARVTQKAQNTILSLRALIEASDDAIIGKTIDGTIVSWNKGAEKMHGYTAEEILGKSVSVLMPPDRPNEFPDIMMRLQGGEHIDRYETKRLHKNGTAIEVSVTISPVKNTAGLIVGVCAVARDITKQTREHEALRLSEERFRVALKNAPIVVSSQDLHLRYTWMSPLPGGMSHEDWRGHTDAEIFGGDEGARLTGIKQEVLRTGMESHVEVTVTVQGRMHYVDLVVAPLRDAEGRLQDVLCSGIDITPLKETIVNLQHAVDEIRTLRGLLPICASCKRIKDENGTWEVLETYLQHHSEAEFSHGLCPDCVRRLYPDANPQ